MRAFILTMLILWSFLFFTYFIRSVLLMATRIEFNKRFSQARMTQIRHRAANSLPSTSHLDTQGATSYTRKVDLEMAAMSSVPEVEELSFSDAWRPAASQLQEQNDPAGNVTRKFKMTHIERLNRLRAATRSQGQEGAAQTTRKRRRFRKGGRLAQKLQTLLNPTNSNVAIEPLTLANPVSEVLKVPVLFDYSVCEDRLRVFFRFLSTSSK